MKPNFKLKNRRRNSSSEFSECKTNKCNFKFSDFFRTFKKEKESMIRSIIVRRSKKFMLAVKIF